MYLARSAILAILLCSSTLLAADDKPAKPCTIISPNTGLSFDLNTIAIRPSEEGSKDMAKSWTASGYDYGTNFTINFCEPVVEPLLNVVGVDRKDWGNVSAYYRLDGDTYSIGQVNKEPVFRGRKLVLNYTMGSPCGPEYTRRSRELVNGGDGDDGPKKSNPKDDDDDSAGEGRRKSTLILLSCDREPLSPKAAISFVGASPDECTYFFEARSAAACGGANLDNQAVGPAGVFGLILLIAAAAYVVGGIAYQRTVMHQRGWRQLPNYSLWASIASFMGDIVIILTSSCRRCLPSRRGYNQLPTNAGNAHGRPSARSEDENRLIDQLDDEWDD